MIANLSSKEVTLPIGTIIASLEIFDENEFETIDWVGTEDDPKISKNKQNKTEKYVLLEEEGNQYLNWKPRQKQKQILIVDDRSKLINTIELEIHELKTNNENKEVEQEENVKEGTTKIKINEEVKKKPYEEVKIDETYLTKEQLKLVKALLKRKAEVERKNEAPSKAINIKHNIDTGNHPPINVPKYRTSHKERPVINEHIKEMLRHKVIEPFKSPWAFPIVLVPKRFCVDRRKLNAITINCSTHI